MAVAPENTAAVGELFQRWNGEIGTELDGSVLGYLLRSVGETRSLTAVVVFRTEEKATEYWQSARSREFLRELSTLLLDVPDWELGEFLAGSRIDDL